MPNDDGPTRIEHFTKPLFDLGAASSDARLSGILSPLYDKKEVSQYMSDHYGSEAGVSSQTFDLTNYYEALMLEAVAQTPWAERMSEVRRVLEVGCGFGSATIPLLKIFPQANVVATELSLQMLMALKGNLKDRSAGDRCRLMQLNAEQLDFEEKSFDLVVGAAVLHHLFHPETVLERSFLLLKPGGIAVFFEPFELGMNVVSLIYQTFLMNWRSRFLSRKVRDYIKNCVSTWQAMSRKPKNDPFFKGADDKWVFTRHFLEAHALRSGFERLLVYPLTKSERPFEEMVTHHFSGNGMPAPTPWMLEIVKSFEDTFSLDAKRDLLTEGAIVLLKSRSAP
jgi:ubiquinone/menaquinone biosynthesis C-methylase UbiE